MKQAIQSLILSLLLTVVAACGMGSPAPAAEQSAPAFPGRRGVNLHSWFTWTPQLAPDRYVFPAFTRQPGELTMAEAKRLRSTGFDFVRLTVDPGVFMTARGTQLAQATDALLSAVARLSGAGLSVIVDLHPISRFEPEPGSGRKGIKALQRGPDDPIVRRFASAAAALAGALDLRFGGTGTVAFESLNEPDLPCGAEIWRAQQAMLHRAVRAAAPRLPLVLTGACWANVDGLVALDPADYDDPNILFTFHFYEEHRFTHQGTNGVDAPQRATSGLPYPWNARSRNVVEAETQSRLSGAGAALRKAVRQNVETYLSKRLDRAKIEERLDKVAAWADGNHIARIRILMGEFGVNSTRGKVRGAREDDRLRWLEDVRRSAERRGFGWALWVHRGNNPGGDAFDLEIDPATGALDRGTLTALGLTAAR